MNGRLIRIQWIAAIGVLGLGLLLAGCRTADRGGGGRSPAASHPLDPRVNLGLQSLLGDGVPQDIPGGMEILSVAEADGSPAAQQLMAVLSAYGYTSENPGPPEAAVSEEDEMGARVLRIRERGYPDSIHGTAFFISPAGHLLTCRHILLGHTNFWVEAGGRVVAAELVCMDAARDLALLQVGGEFPYLRLAGREELLPGEAVFTVGFPNAQLQGRQPKVSLGIINSTAGFRDNPSEYQTSVAIQPGSSGGPLLNAKGEVVGIITSRLDDLAVLKATGSLPQNVSYAVKAGEIYDFLEGVPALSELPLSVEPGEMNSVPDAVSMALHSVVPLRVK